MGACAHGDRRCPGCRYEAAEDVLQVTDLYDPREQWASYLLNAIKAKELFKKEVNYIVKGGEIIIVDEFTGRTMPGRRWSDGLHQVTLSPCWLVPAPSPIRATPSRTALSRLDVQPQRAPMPHTALH